MLLTWIFYPGDALDFPTWEGTIEPGRPLVCVTSEDDGVWFVGQPDPNSVSTCTYNADDVLSETFADPEAAKLAAERWAATHVPGVAEALLREALDVTRVYAQLHQIRADEPSVVLTMDATKRAAAFHARLTALLGDAP